MNFSEHGPDLFLYVTCVNLRQKKDATIVSPSQKPLQPYFDQFLSEALLEKNSEIFSIHEGTHDEGEKSVISDHFKKSIDAEIDFSFINLRISKKLNISKIDKIVKAIKLVLIEQRKSVSVLSPKVHKVEKLFADKFEHQKSHKYLIKRSSKHLCHKIFYYELDEQIYIIHPCDRYSIVMPAMSKYLLEDLRAGQLKVNELIKNLKRRATIDVSLGSLEAILQRFEKEHFFHHSKQSKLTTEKNALAFFRSIQKITPYYKDSSYTQFLDIPLLEKKTIQDHWDAFTTDVFEKMIREGVDPISTRYTSNSSGATPLKMTFPQQFIDERERVSGHVNRKALLFPMIVFNRANNKFDSAHTINKWPAIQYDEKKEIIDISPGNNPTSIDREVMLASIESMLSFNPKSIHGAAEYIASLAYECLKLGIKIPSLRVVDLGHNYPWYPYKKIIEEAFGVPVYTRYHSSENGTIAAMCHKQKTHILERNKYVELITHGKSTRPGEMGAVVITSMDNIYRPFIRYNQGDVAVILPNTCDCGLVSPLIELRGRIHDLTQGSIKPWVTNLEINQLLMHIPHFYHFQITIHADKIDWNIRMENGRDLVKVKDLENKASDLFLRPVKISWMESLNVKGLGKLLGVVNTENKQPKYDYFFKS